MNKSTFYILCLDKVGKASLSSLIDESDDVLAHKQRKWIDDFEADIESAYHLILAGYKTGLSKEKKIESVFDALDTLSADAKKGVYKEASWRVSKC